MTYTVTVHGIPLALVDALTRKIERWMQKRQPDWHTSIHFTQER